MRPVHAVYSIYFYGGGLLTNKLRLLRNIPLLFTTSGSQAFQNEFVLMWPFCISFFFGVPIIFFCLTDFPFFLAVCVLDKKRNVVLITC